MCKEKGVSDEYNGMCFGCFRNWEISLSDRVTAEMKEEIIRRIAKAKVDVWVEQVLLHNPVEYDRLAEEYLEAIRRK